MFESAPLKKVLIVEDPEYGANLAYSIACLGNIQADTRPLEYSQYGSVTTSLFGMQPDELVVYDLLISTFYKIPHRELIKQCEVLFAAQKPVLLTSVMQSEEKIRERFCKGKDLQEEERSENYLRNLRMASPLLHILASKDIRKIVSATQHLLDLN